MLNRSILALAAILLTAMIAGAQESATAPAASPTPKPPVKRRAFDQFDLSNGVRSGSGLNSAGVSSAAAVTERVDERTYDGIARMVKYAEQIESEYRSAEGINISPSDHFEPYRVLGRKLPALFRISEMFLAGLLDQPVLIKEANVALLNENQQILSEMMMISNSSEAQLARNQPKLLSIAEKYGAPTYPVEKRPLLSAMFARLNGNFSRLMNQVVLKK